MGRFVHTVTTKVNGTTLTLATAVEGDAKLLGDAAEALAIARHMLGCALFVLNLPLDDALAPARLAWLDYHFLTGDKPSEEALATILQIYTQTRTGLEADVMLKVGKVFSEEGKEIDGNVALHHTVQTGMKMVEGQLREVVTDWKPKPPKAPQPYHTYTRNRFTGGVSRVGAIHLNARQFGKIDSSEAAITLVHEATHKWAGTTDYLYFNDKGLHEGQLKEPKLALINADSYAWFANWCMTYVEKLRVQASGADGKQEQS